MERGTRACNGRVLTSLAGTVARAEWSLEQYPLGLESDDLKSRLRFGCLFSASSGWRLSWTPAFTAKPG